jgi:DNA repair exonuclease SbcCD ATPase subunit
MDIKIAQQETITELVLENQKLKQERDEWRKSAFEITEQATKSRKELERERDEAREALREAWLAMDEVDGTDRMVNWQNKHASILEGAKCPVCSPEQKCWECADDVSREGAK